MGEYLQSDQPALSVSSFKTRSRITFQIPRGSVFVHTPPSHDLMAWSLPHFWALHAETLGVEKEGCAFPVAAVGLSLIADRTYIVCPDPSAPQASFAAAPGNRQALCKGRTPDHTLVGNRERWPAHERYATASIQ